MNGYKKFQVNQASNSCINPFKSKLYQGQSYFLFFRTLVVDYLRNKIDSKIDNSRFS